MEEGQICMTLVFGLNEVQVGWERPHTPETVSSDWEDELGVNISELHHDREEASIDWAQDWDWTHSGENHPFACQMQDEEIYYSDPEIYYSDPEIYYSDPVIYYSDPDDLLGAAEDEESDEEPNVPAPATVRRSGRAWKPTQQALESQEQEQRWEPAEVPDGPPPEPVPPERQPLDAEPEVEEPVPPEEEGLKVQAPPLDMNPNSLVLDPIPDHEGVRVDTEGEGLGEPDPLVLARSPEALSPAIRQHILDPENVLRLKIETQCCQESKTG